jgi:hypothetical protein
LSKSRSHPASSGRTSPARLRQRSHCLDTPLRGSVRATVVDAFSLNYRVILAKKGCFARNEASHAVNLCDMHAKSAEVVSTAEILSYFNRHSPDVRGSESWSAFSASITTKFEHNWRRRRPNRRISRLGALELAAFLPQGALLPSSSLPFHPQPLSCWHGHARSRAMSDRICWKIRRGTATSGNLGHRVAGMGDDICSDLDDLLTEGSQRPTLDPFRQSFPAVLTC